SGAGLSLSAAKDPKKLEAAVKLLKFLTSAEQFARIRDAVGGGVYPVVLPVSDKIGKTTLDYADSYNEVKIFVQAVGQYDPLPQMLDVTRNAIQGMLAGAATPEQAAKQMSMEQKK